MRVYAVIETFKDGSSECLDVFLDKREAFFKISKLSQNKNIIESVYDVAEMEVINNLQHGMVLEELPKFVNKVINFI